MKGVRVKRFDPAIILVFAIVRHSSRLATTTMVNTPPFHFVRRPPPVALAEFVDAIWYATGRVPYRGERILPNGKPALIFNLGAPFRMTDGTAGAPPETHRDAWLCGNRSRFLINEPVAETDVVGVTFGSHGAAAILGLPMRKISGQVVEADAVLGGRIVAETRERLFHAAGPDARIAVAVSFLLRQRASVTPAPAFVRRAVARLVAPAPPSISTLSAELDVSQKHLIDRFHHHVGLAPKTLLRIHRFERALAALNRPGPVRLEQIALACGYFDQAHFNRDFAAFSGINPTAYAKARAAFFAPPGPPDESGLFVPLNAAGPR